MKYIIVFKRNCRVPNHYKEITESEYNTWIDEIASESFMYESFEKEDGDIDWDKYETLLSNVTEKYEQMSETETGADCGDFILYARPDDFNKYDLPISDR